MFSFICGIFVGFIGSILFAILIIFFGLKFDDLTEKSTKENNLYLDNIGFTAWFKKRFGGYEIDNDQKSKIVNSIKQAEKLFYLVFKYDLDIKTKHNIVKDLSSLHDYINDLPNIILTTNLTDGELEYVESCIQPKKAKITTFRSEFEKSNFKQNEVIKETISNMAKEYIK